jgi:hypothetical protein
MIETMYPVELFLPLYDNQGRRFADSRYAEVRKSLIEKFGGLTAFTRAPPQDLNRRTEASDVTTLSS